MDGIPTWGADVMNGQRQTGFHDFMARFMPMIINMENQKRMTEMWLKRQLEGQRHQAGLQGGVEDQRARNAMMKMIAEQIMSGSALKMPGMQGEAGLADLQSLLPGAVPPGANVPSQEDMAQRMDALAVMLAKIMEESPDASLEEIQAALGPGGLDFITGLLSQMKGDIEAGKDRDIDIKGIESRERASERTAATAGEKTALEKDRLEYLKGLPKKGEKKEEEKEDDYQAKLDKVEQTVRILVDQYGYTEKDARKKAEAEILGKK